MLRRKGVFRICSRYFAWRSEVASLTVSPPSPHPLILSMDAPLTFCWDFLGNISSRMKCIWKWLLSRYLTKGQNADLSFTSLSDCIGHLQLFNFIYIMATIHPWWNKNNLMGISTFCFLLNTRPTNNIPLALPLAPAFRLISKIPVGHVSKVSSPRKQGGELPDVARRGTPWCQRLSVAVLGQHSRRVVVSHGWRRRPNQLWEVCSCMRVQVTVIIEQLVPQIEFSFVIVDIEID